MPPDGNSPGTLVLPGRPPGDGVPRPVLKSGPRLGLAVSHLFERPGPTVKRLAETAEVLEIKRLPEPAWLPRDKPRVFHWDQGLAAEDFPKKFLAAGLDRYLAETPVNLFSFDLGPAARRHLGLLPLSTPLSPAAIRRHSRRALAFVRRFYRGPLAVENYNFYPTGLYGHVTEPEFIRLYLDEFGLGLALDLAHAAITAANRNLRPENYLAALPLSKAAEIHLSRPWLPGGRLWAADSHQAPGEREWAWLELALQRGASAAGPIVLIEYYGESGKLRKAQERLASILRGSACPPANAGAHHDE